MATQKRTHRKHAASAQPSLQSVVGETTYEVWLDMLRILVPGGRRHRLAPMFAGMLRYAVEQSTRKGRRPRPSGALVEALIALDEGDDDAAALVTAAVQRLSQRWRAGRAREQERRAEHRRCGDSRIPTVGPICRGNEDRRRYTRRSNFRIRPTAGRFARCVG